MDQNTKLKITLKLGKNINKQFKDIKENYLLNKEENRISHLVTLIQELSKPIINEKQIQIINEKGINQTSERNINLVLYLLKKYKKFEQFIQINSIPESSLLLLCSLGILQHYKKGDIIYSKKDDAKEFYFIINGTVVIKSLEPKIIREDYENKKYDYKTILKKNENEEKYEKYLDCQYDLDIGNNISKSNFVSKSTERTKRENENKYKEKEEDIINYKKNNNINFNNKDKNHLQMLIKDNMENISPKKSLSRKPIFILKENYDNSDNIYIKSFKELQEIIQLQKDLGCVIDNYTEGCFFGEWDIIYNRQRANIAYADEDTYLLVLEKKYFKEYFKHHILNSELEKKYFIKKRIPILNIKSIPLLIPEFYEKGDIIYTEYDSAFDFFIIYKGLGALKYLKYAKSKNDILSNSDKMETLLIIDKGCIVGLECSKNDNEKIINYENTFVILEPNTIIYRINLKKIDIKKEEKIKLISFLNNLYKKQYNLIINSKQKKTNLKIIEKELLSKEIKINYIINDYLRDSTLKKEKEKKEKNNLNINSINKFTMKRKSTIIFLEQNRRLTSEKKINSFKSNISIKSDSKCKLKKRYSKIGHNIITPFIINNNANNKIDDDNPINKYKKSININMIDLKRNNITRYSSVFLASEIDKNNKIKILRNTLSKPKNNIRKRRKNYEKSEKKSFDEIMLKFIFKKDYKRIKIFSNTSSEYKKSLLSYNSGNFDMPLLSLKSKSRNSYNI